MKSALTISLCCWLCVTALAEPSAITGVATYYTTKSCQREGTSGTVTASGRRYNESALTCALPFRPKEWGKKYRITNVRNGLSVIVKHMDLGPGKKARSRGVVVDLTPAAFEAIGGKLSDGKMMVRMEAAK